MIKNLHLFEQVNWSTYHEKYRVVWYLILLTNHNLSILPLSVLILMKQVNIRYIFPVLVIYNLQYLQIMYGSSYLLQTSIIWCYFGSMSWGESWHKCPCKSPHIKYHVLYPGIASRQFMTYITFVPHKGRLEQWVSVIMCENWLRWIHIMRGISPFCHAQCC